VDSVRVVRNLTGLDKGIHSRKTRSRLAGHAPESISGAGQKGDSGRDACG
jgi:hypothetical protein